MPPHILGRLAAREGGVFVSFVRPSVFGENTGAFGRAADLWGTIQFSALSPSLPPSIADLFPESESMGDPYFDPADRLWCKQNEWTGQIPNIYCTLLISSAIVGYCKRCKYCCRYLYNASVYYFLKIKLIHGPKRIEIIYQKFRYLSLSLARSKCMLGS